MRRLLKFMALGSGLLLALYVAWGIFIAGESSWHVFWTISRPHYRLSFAIQTADGVHSAQTVVEAEYFEIPSWEKMPPLDMGEGFCCGETLVGGAAASQLPNGEVVCMLLDNVNVFGAPRRYSVFEIADALLTDIPNSPFASAYGRQRMIDARTGSLVSGGADIPLDLMPPMVVFTEQNNPHSAHVFDPRNPERWLGPDAKFLGARIEVTREAVGSDILSLLPWLRVPPELRDRHGVDMIVALTTPDDPFASETRRGLLRRANFLWRGL
jgi:hypothetical protein